MLIILFSLLTELTTLTASGADVAACQQDQTSEFAIDFKNDLEEIIEHTACDAPAVMLEEARKEYEQNYSKKEKTTAVVDGLTLSATGEELAVLEEVLRTKQGHKDDVPHSKWPAVAAGCTSVVCALGKLYGSQEAGFRVLNIAAKSGYILTASQKHNTYLDSRTGVPFADETLWTPSQIRQIDKMLKNLPESLSKNPKLRYIYNSKYDYSEPDYVVLKGRAIPMRTKTSGGKATSSGGKATSSGELVMYSPSARSSEDFEQTLLHELAHHFDYTKGHTYLTDSGFSSISKWNKPEYKPDNKTSNTETKYFQTSQRKDNFVTNYAKETEHEDFAETVDTYVRYPEFLASVSPEKYEFVKKEVFNGKEYKETSPDLDEELAGFLKDKSLTDYCLERAYRIVVSGDNRVLYYEYDSPAIKIMTTGFDADDAYRGTRCFDELAAKLAKKSAKKSAEKLDSGLQCFSGIEHILKRRNSVEFEKRLRKTRDGIRLANETAHERCISKKNFTKACVFGAAVSDEIMPLIEDKKLYTELMALYPPEKLLLDCLSKVNKITRIDGTTQYWEPLEGGGRLRSTEATTLPGCYQSINARLSDSQIKYETVTNYQDMLFSQDANYKMLKGLDGLVSGFAVEYEKCLADKLTDKSNMHTCRVQVVKDWAQKNQLSITTTLTELSSLLERLLIDTGGGK